MYKIFTTDEFEKDYSKLSPIEQSRVKKIFRQLKESGSDIGKPLSRLSFFREKKFDGKRLYFLIYKNIFIILALGISNKKAQQSTINRILIDLAQYQEYVYKKFMKKD